MNVDESYVLMASYMNPENASSDLIFRAFL